jgi:recombination protein RecA
MGGRALPFFGSIRLDLTVTEKLKDANEDIYAYIVKVYAAKNKVSPPFRSCPLTYVMGEGFSKIFDFFNMGLKLGIIEKKTGWFKYGDVKIQGELNFYRKMKSSPDLFESIKSSIEDELNSAGAAGISNG